MILLITLDKKVIWLNPFYISSICIADDESTKVNSCIRMNNGEQWVVDEPPCTIIESMKAD